VAAAVDAAGAEDTTGAEDMTGAEDVVLAVADVVGEAAVEQAVIRMALINIRARRTKILREDIFYSFILFLIPKPIFDIHVIYDMHT
jgi:hypothetical protein